MNHILNNPNTAGPKEFIILMAVLMSVVAISIDAMLPALGIIGQDLKVSHPNQAQYIISCIFAGMAIGQLINGPLSDAMGRKRILYINLILYFIGSIICLSAMDITTMLIGRFIQGIGISGPYISILSIVRDRYSGKEMAKIMSLVMTIFIMVPAIAPALGQVILHFTSWHVIFGFYIAYALVVGVWVFFRLEETLPPKRRTPYNVETMIKGLKTVLSNRITCTYTLAMGCIFGVLMGYLNTIQQVFQVQYNVGNMFAVYFGFQALAFGLASYINSRLVEKYGMRTLCLYTAIVMLVTSIVVFGVGIMMPVPFEVYYVSGMVLLFSFGVMFGNLKALAMEPMGNIAGMAAAFIGSTSSVIGTISGTMIGQFYEDNVVTIVAGFAIMSICALIIMASELSCKLKAI